MWGFEPKQMDMFLAENADFIQDVRITDPTTGDPYTPPAGSRVFFRVGNDTWEGTLNGSLARFKVESETTNQVKRGATVQFCISVGEDDWVLTQGRVVRG